MIFNTVENLSGHEDDCGDHVILHVEVGLRLRDVEPLDPVLLYGDILDGIGSVDGRAALFFIVPQAVVFEVGTREALIDPKRSKGGKAQVSLLWIQRRK